MIPTDPYSQGPLPASSPANPSTTDSGSTSDVPPQKPVTPGSPDQTSGTDIGTRNIGLVSPGRLAVNSQAQRAQSLQQSYIHQRDTVNAIRVQQFFLSEIDTLVKQLDRPGGDTTHLPFVVIHVNADGSMENLIPPAPELAAQPDKLQKINTEVKRQFEKIDAHYRRTETKNLAKQLEKAEMTLTGYEHKLKEEGIPIPVTPVAVPPVSITRMSRRMPQSYSPSQPSQSSPGEFVFQKLPKTPQMDDEDEEELSLVNSTSQEPSSLEQGAYYLQILNYYPVFQKGKKKYTDFNLKAEHALLLRSSEVQNPNSLLERYGTPHIARKALLFKIMMNLYKQHHSNEAKAISPEIIELVQLGMLVTDVNKDQILTRTGATSEAANCKRFLTDAINVTPQVADVVAGIVTGTAHQNSLPAQILRNVERVEEMRFQDEFDINTLEAVPEQDPDNACLKKCTSRLVSQWRYLLEEQGELDHVAALVNASGIQPPEGGYVSNNKPDIRQQIKAIQYPFAFQNAEINTRGENINYLKELLYYLASPSAQE